MADRREYRVMWSGEGSSLELQIGPAHESKTLAEFEARGKVANGLRLEGARIWIESRRVGPWLIEDDPAPAKEVPHV